MVIYAPLSLVLSTLRKRNIVKAFSWESGYEVTRVTRWRESCYHRLPRWRIDRLPIVLCCLSLLRFIETAKRNQQCVGPLKWESGAKVTRCYLILFFHLEKDLESPIGLASLTNRNIPVHKLLLVSSNRREERLH